MGSKMSCCKKEETFGMDRSKFEKTYSPVFAPFLVNVVVKLLNDTGDRSFELDDFISRWGGGIKLLRKCAKKQTLDPEDSNCNWDTLVAKCVNATPISHNIWIELLKWNKIEPTTSHIQNLENLLMQWVENGHKYRTYGPYPKAPEQELYIQDTIPPRISEILNYAVINDVFADSYAAMDSSKKGRIRKSITGDNRGHIDRVVSGSLNDFEMKEVTSETDHRRQKSAKDRSIELDVRPTDAESIKVHWCLWIGILLIAGLFVIIMIFGHDQYMVSSWMNYSQNNDGFWYQDWGWKTSVIHDNTESGIPLPISLFHSARIQNDISAFIVIVFLMVLVFLCIIIFVLLMRIKEKKGYYFYVGRIKIPQRPIVYVLFEMITVLMLCLLLMFLMLLIFGMVELIPYARTLCLLSGNDSECRGLVFPVPHVGFFVLLLIPFSMNCWMYKYAAQLDYKLDYKTMRIYYAEHYGKLAANQQGIYLYDLIDCMKILRKLLLLMLFAICLQESGMIIWVHVTNTGNNSSSSVFLQPLGLNNVNIFSGGWVDAGTSFSVFIPIFMAFHFVLLCYCIHVFLNWKVYKIVKYVFLLLVTVEIVIWFILGLVFYFDFNRYWNENGLGAKLTEIGDADEVGVQNYWLPDYGILLHLVIWGYMLRLWYRITKAM